MNNSILYKNITYSSFIPKEKRLTYSNFIRYLPLVTRHSSLATHYSAFINVNAPKLKKAMFAVHAAMLGGNISPYPSDKQKL